MACSLNGVVGVVVVWTTDRSGNRAPGMGIKFIDLPDDERGRLMELVNAIAYFDE